MTPEHKTIEKVYVILKVIHEQRHVNGMFEHYKLKYLTQKGCSNLTL